MRMIPHILIMVNFKPLFENGRDYIDERCSVGRMGNCENDSGIVTKNIKHNVSEHPIENLPKDSKHI